MDEHGLKQLTPQGISDLLSTRTEASHFVVAYSGGVDSRVLLELMAGAAQLNTTIKVSALHIHHGLSPNADDWAKHCESVCEVLQVPLSILWVNAEVYEGRSPEEVAREARFSAFDQFLKPSECLLLAHHEEDQTETILLRLFRGAGPKGLSGMPERAMLGQGEIFRPLLMVSKQDILQYAKTQKLTWIEDDSNYNTRFDRNFLRQEILPKLSARWPRVVRSVSRAGALCLETTTAVQVLAQQDFETVQGKLEDSLSVVALLNLDPIRRRGVIRYWLQRLDCLSPSRDHMDRIDTEILQAKPDAKPKLKLGDYELRRQKKDLIRVKLNVSGKKRIKMSNLVSDN